MINNTDTDLYYYNNPLIIQEDILDDLELRIDNKGYVADPNNTFGFLLESFSTIVSNCVQKIECKFNSLYSKRAQSIEDLYNHISDFDYLSFQASPSNMTIGITLIKSFLVNNAIDYNDHYKLLIIPKNTKFAVGNIFFSLYHDIFIKVNKNTNNILLGYNTEDLNPLYTLKNYDIPFREFTYSGIKYLSFEIPIYQFERFVIEETIDNSIGFIKKYNFENKFYALRMFDTVNDFEFNYSFSDMIYDPLKPTCIIKIFQDKNEIELSIPQIYFTNKQISSKLKIELYSTLGETEINIDTSNTKLIKATFIIDDNDPYVEYVNAFKTLQTIIFSPISSKILGGENSVDFETIKNNVIYNLYKNRVPISNLDIENYFQEDGFEVITQVDNLTERVYYALKYIYDINKDKLPIVTSNISLNISDLDLYKKSIKSFSDGNIVIMPNTIFLYNKNTNKSVPLTDDAVESLNNKIPENYISDLNENTYTKNIYHTFVTNNKFNPEAISFDLISCEAKDILFEKENVYVPLQASVIDATLVHLNNGCGGYKFTIGIHKSEELKNISEEDFLVYLTCETKVGSLVGKRLIYEETIGDLYVYSTILESDYYLTKETISLINMDYSIGYIGRHNMNFNTKANVSFFIKDIHVPGISQDNDIFNTELIGVYHGNNNIAISKQSISLIFGYNLQDVVQNTLTASYNPKQYETYDENVYDTYTKDIYERNDDGTLKYTIDQVTNSVILHKLHESGDIKTYEEIPVERLEFLFDNYSTEEEEILVQFDSDYIIKFNKGDIKFDEYGNPILISDRILNLTIETFQLDLKYYSVPSFNLKYIYSLLQTYFLLIREKQNNLYGNTLIYFKPISTLGYGTFQNSLDESIDIDLDISLGFKIYLHSYLFSNEGFLSLLEKDIITFVKEKLNDNVFSLITIANLIKSKFPDYIQNVDIKGINDDITLQTLVKTTKDKNINIKKYLYLDNNNEINIKDDISIDFIEVV